MQLLQSCNKIFNSRCSVLFTCQPSHQVKIQSSAHVTKRFNFFVLQQTSSVSLNNNFNEELFSRCGVPATKDVRQNSNQTRISATYFSRCVCGALFLRRTTDEASALPTEAALSLTDELPDVCDCVDGGLTISLIFGFTVVEKLRPRAIDPNIRLKSSAFGLTGAVCCVRCSLLPITNEFRGDSTSFGSNENEKSVCFLFQ